MFGTGSKKESTVDTLNREFDRVQDEFAALRSRITALAGETLGDLQVSPQRFADLRRQLEVRLGDLEGEMEQISKRLTVQGAATARDVERRVHERPFASLALAFGAGMLVARLLRRSAS